MQRLGRSHSRNHRTTDVLLTQTATTSFPPLGETIGTVIPDNIPAVLHGSPCGALLNDAQGESLTMEQQDVV